jgi:hypothetical protein
MLMKIRSTPHPAALCLLFVSFSGIALGQTLQYWNASGTGGDGIWGTGPGDKNWNLVPGALVGNTAWDDGIDDVAVFQDMIGGTVTVFDTVQTAGIVQNGANYTINAGIIVLAPDSSLNAPFVNVQSGVLTMDAQLAGSAGFVKTGAGALILTAANPYTGLTAIEAGTLNLAGSLASTSLSISSGASLLNQNGGFSSGATLTIAGSLTLNSNDTITSYISNGGTLTTGPGTLFTTSAALNGGSTVAGLLNTGTLGANGAVLISGTATAGTASIQSGTLTLSGSLISDTVGIASGASLLNQSGGLSNSATLTNAGSLTLTANDTITSYISNGGTLTNGAGTLFTTSAEINNGSTVAGLLNTGTLTSAGAVSISGTATVSNTAAVQSGTFTLTGTLSTPILNISSGATMIQNGTMGPGTPALATTVVTNEGSFIIQKSAVLKTYTSNGGLLDIQNDRMITQNVFLNDGSITKGGPFSADLLTTTGAVRIENSALGAQAVVASGELDLVGSIGANDVQIATGATLLNRNGGLRNTATVTNAGSLALFNSDQIATYTSNGGTLDVQNGGLTTQNVFLNDGSTTMGGIFSADLMVSNGAVRIEGGTMGNQARIASGVLTLTGTLGFTNLSIDSGATLYNQSGEFSHTAFLTNAGSLTLDANGQVMTYTSNGGTLTAGPGTLFSNNATLNDGSSIAGLLDTDTLTSDGVVQVSGAISADSININTGTLNNTGTLGNGSTLLNITGGATLVAGGTQSYSLLTTSGTGPGNWVGDLANTANIAPGGLGGIGTLAVAGDFSQSAGGMLTLDLSALDNDLLDITGSATFNGALVLNQLGSAIAPFVPVTVVSASAYAGNITSLSENLDGVVFFNPGNGTVTRLELPSGGGGSFFGATRNQTSTWISLYDDVIDPGIINITSGPGGYGITSGIADVGNPDLLWALSASFTPDGLNAALLNRLSPEVYVGFSDYAMQATRAHQRSALSAPPLVPRDVPGSAKGGAKAAITPAAAPLDWEFFAAVDYFRAGTDNSRNQADYDFHGSGVLGGARTRLREHTQLAVYLGADSGTIDGDLINADALGWTFGLIGEHLVHEKTRTRLTAGISYGSYLFDGTRGSASATGAGWTPGKVDFDDVDVDAFDLFIGVDGVAWQKDALTLLPSAGLRYARTTMDSFNESTGGAPGAPIALDVSRDRHESLLLELGLLAQMEVNPRLSLWGEGGLNIGLLGNSRAISANFAKGSRAMRAEAGGLDDDSLYLGCGAIYQVTADISAAIGYRADLRSGAESQQELRLSSSWRF